MYNKNKETSSNGSDPVTITLGLKFPMVIGSASLLLRSFNEASVAKCTAVTAAKIT